jgi:transposase
MDQKTQFIADYLRGVLSTTELADLYGISRKTAHKIINRYLREGPAGLESISASRTTRPITPQSTSSARCWVCAGGILPGVRRSC